MADLALEPSIRRRKVRPITIDGEIAIVPLTRGLVTVIDAADAPLVQDFNWCALVTQSGHAYAVRTKQVDGVRAVFLMHRVIMATPPEQEVDHEDDDGLNNRRSNLRNCSHRQNMANQFVSRRSKLGLKGASPHKKRFRAKIQIGDQRFELGSFETAQEAAAAYRGAAIILHGEFANKG